MPVDNALDHASGEPVATIPVSISRVDLHIPTISFSPFLSTFLPVGSGVAAIGADSEMVNLRSVAAKGVSREIGGSGRYRGDSDSAEVCTIGGEVDQECFVQTRCSEV